MINTAASSDDGEERGSVKQLKILTPPSVCSSAAPVERTAVERAAVVQNVDRSYASRSSTPSKMPKKRMPPSSVPQAVERAALMPSSVSPSSLPPTSVPPSSVLLWREEVECRVYTAAEVMMPLLFCRK